MAHQAYLTYRQVERSGGSTQNAELAQARGVGLGRRREEKHFPRVQSSLSPQTSLEQYSLLYCIVSTLSMACSAAEHEHSGDHLHAGGQRESLPTVGHPPRIGPQGKQASQEPQLEARIVPHPPSI
jgi:hypothetical protein